MKIKTKVFGEVTIDDDKAIYFPAGIIGFPDMTEFALIHDEEREQDRSTGCSPCRSLLLPCRSWIR